MVPQRRKRRTIALGVVLSGVLGLDPAGWSAGSAAAQSAPATIVISGGGYGHGVGMSQYSARGRADAGQTAAEILAASYPGAPLASIAQGAVRVKLGDAATLSIIGAGLWAAADGDPGVAVAGPTDTLTLSVDGVGNVWRSVNGSAAVLLAPAGGAATVDWLDGDVISVATFGRRYRHGRLIVRPSGPATLEVVLVDLPMQRYLDGLGEMPSSWPMEALRAQAIAGRTFAAYRLANPRTSRYDLLASTFDQAYVGDDKPAGPQGTRWVEAVNSTADQVVTSGGVPIQAFYSSSNGGHSEASDVVFVTPKPYLVAAPDPFDAATGNTNFRWTRTYSGDELAAWLREAGRGDVGSVVGVEVGPGSGVSGRIDRSTLTVSGTTGTISIPGRGFRSVINARAGTRQLLSTLFAFSGAVPGPTAPGGDARGAALLVAPWGDRAALLIGWATDPDLPTGSVDVLVSVDGRLVARVPANRSVAAVGRLVPEIGPDHTWAAMVPASGRSLRICSAVVNVGLGAPVTRMGCTTITRPASAVKRSAAKKPARKSVKRSARR